MDVVIPQTRHHSPLAADVEFLEEEQTNATLLYRLLGTNRVAFNCVQVVDAVLVDRLPLGIHSNAYSIAQMGFTLSRPQGVLE